MWFDVPHHPQFWFHYKQPVVRALLWVLLSPNLLVKPRGNASLVAQEWGWQIFVRHQPWFQALDANPQPLLDWLARKPSWLLGVRFENLLIFLFQYLRKQGDIKDFYHHIAIEDAQCTRLGELDLVFLSADTQSVTHWENAVKFYLLRPEQFGVERLCGVNGGEWLEHKITHLFSRQLGISNMPEARISLAQHCTGLRKQDLTQMQRQAYIKGALFYPLNGGGLNQKEQQQLNPQSLRGRWCYANEFHLVDPLQSGRWLKISKLDWIVPQFYPYHDDDLLRPNEMQIVINSHFRQSKRSLMLAHFKLDETTQQWYECERLVVVHPLWPTYRDQRTED